MDRFQTESDIGKSTFGVIRAPDNAATRRHFLIGLAALPIVSTVPFAVARAQARNPLGVVLEARGAGRGWRNRVLEAKEPLSPGQLLETVAVDADQRRNLARSLSDASENDLRRSFLPETEDAAKIIAGLDVPLVPSPQLIGPETPRVLPPADPAVTDPAWVVVVDIVFDALDIGFNRAIVQKTIESDPELRGLFELAFKAITTRDWQTVAGVLDKILELVFFGDLLGRLYKTAFEIYGERAARKIVRKSVFKLALRFVPFVGWVYVGGSVILAIKQNFHRFA